MAMTINTNIQSLNAQRNLGTSQSSLSTSMQRLSSGLRINSAKDDAAGLAIAERMSAQVRGLNQAQRNANDGVSLAQTAEGALGTIGGNLQRIRELAVQSRNATNSTEDRAALQKEVAQLTSEIDRVASTTSFNGTKLLDGSFTSQAFQVGANQGQTIDIASIQNSSVSQLGDWNSVVQGAKTTSGAVQADATSTPVTTTAAFDFSALEAATGFAGGDVTIGDKTVTLSAIPLDAAKTAPSDDAAMQKAIADQIYNGFKDQLPAGVSIAYDGAGKIDLTNASLDDTIKIAKTGTEITAANATAAAGTGAFSALTGDNFKINGVGIEVKGQYSSDPNARRQQLVDAINGYTSQTNVTASVQGDKVVLNSKTGDIKIETDKVDLLAANGFKAVDTAGTVDGYKAAETKKGFQGIDVSTVEGSDNAILAMDAALKSVNSARADLGAIQNRFESVVSNLSVNSETLSASKSRIMDADFASETANLSRSQILQQAGTAMVAQANQLPQGVLSLLR